MEEKNTEISVLDSLRVKKSYYTRAVSTGEEVTTSRFDAQESLKNVELDEEQKLRVDIVRNATIDFLECINDIVPEGHRRDLCQDYIEVASFYAIKQISRSK